MIGIVDYGMGNLRSVLKALAYLGFEARLVPDPSDLQYCDRLIIPGVGAFAMAMSNLTARGFVPLLRETAAAGTPILGICLGMQLLGSTGSEPVPCTGLNLIPGHVGPLRVSPGIPLPHVGWNNLCVKRVHPLFERVRRDVDVYFVHSYALQPKEAADVLCTADYDGTFVAAVTRNNVIGFQFHPEKSQVAGMKMLENFCTWDGSC